MNGGTCPPNGKLSWFIGEVRGGKTVSTTNIKLEVPVGVSNRHVHLSQEHLEQLFGPGYELTHLKDLGQPGQYACKETVSVVGSKGVIENVRILGPIRKNSQVEISRTDAFKLGLKAPIRDSGDHSGTPGCVLVGPRGLVALDQGVIIAARHIHMTPAMANKCGLKDKDLVSVIVNGERGLIFNNVLIRVRQDFALEIHLDIDEANGALLNNGDKVIMLTKKQDALSLVG
ncbi:MAG TPA: phosphate propanoyltransferase [Clostridia bacterium]|nr:phosphate propanoyltransferase [Clostridia bacterium]